jgi:YVTN family beta-propeller protein
MERRSCINGVLGILLMFSASTLSANFAYMTSGSSNDAPNNLVFVIDTSTNTIVATITVGSRCVGVAITPDGTRAYVANLANSNVSVIDTSNNTVVATVTVGVNPEFIAIGKTSLGTMAYVSNSDPAFNNVSVIDTATNTVIATVAVGTHPNSVAMTPDGTRVYVENVIDSTVSVIDTAHNVVIATVMNVPSTGQFSQMAITPDGALTYVPSGGSMSNSVSVINNEANEVNLIIPISQVPTDLNTQAPTAMAITPDGTKGYITTSQDTTSPSLPDSVVVIDMTTSQVIATIPVGSDPRGIAITPDGTTAYVTSYNLGTQTPLFISVIDVATNTLVMTIPSSVRTFAIAITPGPTSPTATNLTVVQKKNDFGLEYELFNHLEWQPSPVAAANYFIFRDGVKIATVDGSTFSYNDHNQKQGAETIYSISAIDSRGNTGGSVYATIQ